MADKKSDQSVSSIYNRNTGMPDSVNTQKLSVTGTSASTTVLTGNASYEISCDVTCHICYAKTATAATTDHPWFFAGCEAVRHVPKGETWYISAIQDTSSGTMFVTEIIPDRLG